MFQVPNQCRRKVSYFRKEFTKAKKELLKPANGGNSEVRCFLNPILSPLGIPTLDWSLGRCPWCPFFWICTGHFSWSRRMDVVSLLSSRITVGSLSQDLEDLILIPTCAWGNQTYISNHLGEHLMLKSNVPWNGSSFWLFCFTLR